MAKGFSLHIGINKVDRRRFKHNDYKPVELRGCRNDAEAMKLIAELNGFEVLNVLLDGAATWGAVDFLLREAAGQIKQGDTFLLTFSGHGVLVSRGFNYRFEDEGGHIEGEYDEALVLSDRLLKDDDINTYLGLFAEGANIIFVCDSCHSCTPYEYIARGERSPLRRSAKRDTRHGTPQLKDLDQNIVDAHVREHRDLYEAQARINTEQRRFMKANLAMLSACRDDQKAYDGVPHGRFTAALMTVLTQWTEKPGQRFSGNYSKLMADVQHYLGSAQDSCYTPLGPDKDKPTGFFHAPSFTIFEGKR